MPQPARMDSRLREARLQRGLSQEELARMLGVSRQTIVNIEKGITIPNVLLALAIATAVAWVVSELFKEGRPGGDAF
jgi:putative transcriptional regulator